MPGMQQPMPGMQQPMPGMQQPMPGMQQPMPGMQQPMPGYPPGFGAPMPMQSPATSGSSSTKWILGIAGGGCLLLLVVGAIVAVVMMLGAASVSLASAPGGTSPPSSVETRKAEDIPAGASVRSLLAGSCAGFSLVSTPPVRQLGTELTDGLIDAAGGMYNGAGGMRLIQFWLSYGDESTARSKIDTTYAILLTSVGAKNIRQGQLVNEQGRSVGQYLVIQETLSAASPAPAAHPCYGYSLCQHVYWSNGRYLSFLSSPPPHARSFFEAGLH
ncbi:MAG: hypothetical protein HY898_14735 [Deltaproteobacteria bacterium]|nr:hypothetical protein [Deltaproteobacteria bacterium]